MDCNCFTNLTIQQAIFCEIDLKSRKTFYRIYAILYVMARRRRSNQRNYALYVAIGVLAVLIFIFLSGGIAGFATAKNVGFSITIGNRVPNVTFVSEIAAQSPVEAGIRFVTFDALVNDSDGTSNIATVQGIFNKTGETSRFNSSCTKLSDITATLANYTCTIRMQYFDAPGSWSINVTATDVNGAEGINRSTIFTYNQLVAMVLFPDNLTWDSLAPTDTNSTATNDPTQINNTGNANNNVSVTAFDLHGEVNTGDRLNAANFTVDIETGSTCSGPACIECDQTFMANNSAVTVEGATLPRGNFSVLDTTTGKEQFFYCLTAINDSISSQAYSSSLLGPWVITAFAL